MRDRLECADDRRIERRIGADAHGRAREFRGRDAQDEPLGGKVGTRDLDGKVAVRRRGNLHAVADEREADSAVGRLVRDGEHRLAARCRLQEIVVRDVVDLQGRDDRPAQIKDVGRGGGVVLPFVAACRKLEEVVETRKIFFGVVVLVAEFMAEGLAPVAPGTEASYDLVVWPDQENRRVAQARRSRFRCKPFRLRIPRRRGADAHGVGIVVAQRMTRKVGSPCNCVRVRDVFGAGRIRQQLRAAAVGSRLGLVEERHLHAVGRTPRLERVGLEQRLLHAVAVGTPERTGEDGERVVRLPGRNLRTHEIVVVGPFSETKRVHSSFPDPVGVRAGVRLQCDEGDAVRGHDLSRGIQKREFQSSAFRERRAAGQRQVDGHVGVRLKCRPVHDVARHGTDAVRPFDHKRAAGLPRDGSPAEERHVHILRGRLRLEPVGTILEPERPRHVAAPETKFNARRIAGEEFRDAVFQLLLERSPSCGHEHLACSPNERRHFRLAGRLRPVEADERVLREIFRGRKRSSRAAGELDHVGARVRRDVLAVHALHVTVDVVGMGRLPGLERARVDSLLQIATEGAALVGPEQHHRRRRRVRKVGCGGKVVHPKSGSDFRRNGNWQRSPQCGGPRDEQCGKHRTRRIRPRLFFHCQFPVHGPVSFPVFRVLDYSRAKFMYTRR